MILKDIKELFDDTIQDYDVRIVEPKIGKSLKDYDCINDKPEIDFTENKNDDLKIIQVYSPAFIYERGDEKTILSTSKVKILRYKGE